MLAVLLWSAGCTVRRQDAPARPTAAAVASAPAPSAPSQSPDWDREHGCHWRYTSRVSEDSVRFRLHRRVDRLITGAGWVNFGGDHDWFNATATAARTHRHADVRRHGVSLNLYPEQMACSMRGSVFHARSTTLEGIRVTVGRRFGQHAITFTCDRTVHYLSAEQVEDVHALAAAFTAQLRGTCGSSR
jgi:hypothetical protein